MMVTVDEIYEQMMDAFVAETGMETNRDGDLGVRLYAVAAQVFALYVQADWVQRQGFPQTADGNYLDLHGQLRGLTRRPATKAQGVITFQGEASSVNRVIAEGTVCLTASAQRFETTQAGVLVAGATSVDVPAQAVESGSSGNVAAQCIVSMGVAPVGIGACTNESGFSGGSDAEGDGDFRARVMETFERLPNGANAAFYQQGAMSFDEVVAASVIPRSRGIGTVDVVIATKAGTPSQTLLNQVTDYFESRREIAVDVEVLAPENKTVDISVELQVAGGQDAETVCDRVSQAILGYCDGRLLGGSLLRAKLGELIFSVEGVENYHILAPTADVTALADELIVLDDLTVEVM